MYKDTKDNSQYALIDFFKLFFAICIVALHTKLMDSDHLASYMIVQGIFRLGVPFYFTSSGLLLYKSIKKHQESNKNEIAKKYAKRLLYPIVLWMALDLPAEVYKIYVKFGSLKKVIEIIIKEFLFYQWGAMWYAVALLISILILVKITDKIKVSKIVSIFFFFYLFALVGNNYYFIIENTIFSKIMGGYLDIFLTVRNAIFEGIFFVSLGMLIAKIKEENQYNKKYSFILMIISYILLLLEIILIKNNTHIDDRSLYLSFVIFIPLLVLTLTDINCKINTTKIRNYSAGIYFSHIFMKDIFYVFVRLFNINYTGFIQFICVLGMSIIFLSVIYRLDNRKLNKFVK